MQILVLPCGLRQTTHFLAASAHRQVRVVIGRLGGLNNSAYRKQSSAQCHAAKGLQMLANSSIVIISVTVNTCVILHGHHGVQERHWPPGPTGFTPSAPAHPAPLRVSFHASQCICHLGWRQGPMGRKWCSGLACPKLWDMLEWGNGECLLSPTDPLLSWLSGSQRIKRRPRRGWVNWTQR